MIPRKNRATPISLKILYRNQIHISDVNYTLIWYHITLHYILNVTLLHDITARIRKSSGVLYNLIGHILIRNPTNFKQNK